MILRRLSSSLQNQDWATVLVEIVIVVVGVFLGIQASNWNEERAFKNREQVLLHELQVEAAQNIAEGVTKGEAFLVGAGSARRVLAIFDRGGPACTDDCWEVLVDLMHASQWQQIFNSWPTYDELRQDGLPSDRRIIELIEKYQALTRQITWSLSVLPVYRSLVRRMIPIEVQDAYWQNCFNIKDAIEIYLYPCPGPEDLTVDPAMIADIFENPEIAQTLREWTSITRVVGEALVTQQRERGAAILETIAGDGKPGS